MTLDWHTFELTINSHNLLALVERLKNPFDDWHAFEMLDVHFASAIALSTLSMI